MLPTSSLIDRRSRARADRAPIVLQAGDDVKKVRRSLARSLAGV